MGPPLDVVVVGIGGVVVVVGGGVVVDGGIVGGVVRFW